MTLSIGVNKFPDFAQSLWREYFARGIQGLLLFLPETFIGSQSWHLVFIAYSLFMFPPNLDHRDNQFLIFIALIALNSVLGLVVGHQPVSIFASNGIVGAATLLLAFFAARTMNSVSWAFVLGLIALEAAATFYQVWTGVLYFSEAQVIADSTREWSHGISEIDILYSLRPLGFSFGSTAVSFKLILGLIIAAFVPLPQRIRIGIFIFLSAALILNFKRSSILALFLWAGLILVRDIFFNGWKIRHAVIFLVLAVGGAIILDELARQFSLGRYTSFIDFITNVDVFKLGGRTDLWNTSLSFISSNPFFGNFSSRLINPQSFFLNSAPTSGNSFIALAAMHGLFLALIFGFFVLRHIIESPKRFFFLAPIFILAMFDEIIFYYVSTADILFYYLLTNKFLIVFPTAKTTALYENERT